LLYVACLLHDIALTDRYRPPQSAACFAVHGGEVARTTLRSLGVEASYADEVAKTIALHMNIRVPVGTGREAHLLHIGAYLDVAGSRAGDLPRQAIREVVAKHPRDGFPTCFATLMRRESTERPHSRAALLWRLGMRLPLQHNPLDRCLAHGIFSVAVVVASLGTAGLRTAGADALPVLGGVGVIVTVLGVVVLGPGSKDNLHTSEEPKPQRRLEPVLLVFGVLCALAYVVENAWQSWSAVHLDTSLNAAPGLASSAPAVFAAAAATGRIGGNALLRRLRPVQLLVAGGVIAAVGSITAAAAGTAWLALIGVGVAGLGTSVCAPTIIGLAGAWAGPERRAGAISTVTTLAYLGFLLGPAAVGAASSAWSLPVALGGVAVLALVVAALGPVAARQSQRQPAG
jgi:hypothetical protein